jgi:hypothetical protein
MQQRFEEYRNGQMVRTWSETVPDDGGVQDSIHDALISSLVDNRAFVALTPPTNAQLVAQVKQLCAQNNRLIRLLFAMFDAAN